MRSYIHEDLSNSYLQYYLPEDMEEEYTGVDLEYTLAKFETLRVME